MVLSPFLLSATLVVLGTPPLHHHSPQLGQRCVGHVSGFALNPQASMGGGRSEDWPWDAMMLEFSDFLVQHHAPTVVLLEAGPPVFDLSRQVFSSDLPALWTPVRYGPLTVEVRLVTTAEMAESLEHVMLLLDNRPLEPRRHALPAEPPRMLETGLLQIAYRYSLPCPPPGKHILQARYKLDGIWSRLSMPLHFEVRLPDPPRIIAISDGNGQPVPIRSGQTILIAKSSLRLQLADINHNASLVAYVNGKPIMPSGEGASCCRIVQLGGHIAPGVHRLTVRTIHRDGGCAITSEPSNEVLFHYYDEDVYLLRPGRSCNNRQKPSHDSCKPASTSAATAASHAAAAAANEAKAAATNAANSFHRIGDLYQAENFSAVPATRAQMTNYDRIVQDRRRTAQDQQEAAGNQRHFAAEAQQLVEKDRSATEQARATSAAALERIANALDHARNAQSSLSAAASAPTNSASAFKDAEAARDQSQRDRATAANHESAALELRAAAETWKHRIDSDAHDARVASARAHRHAEELARCGDTAEARIAQRYAVDAAKARDVVTEHAAAAARIFQNILDLATEVSVAAQRAAVHAEDAEQAAGRAARANTMTQGAKVEADEAKRHAEQAIQAAVTVGEHAAVVRAAAQKAVASYAKMQAAKDQLDPLQKSAAAGAANAEANAQAAGTVQRLESEGAAAWERAVAESVHQRLERRKAAAAETSEQPVDVHLAEFDANAAEVLADQEEAKARARIRQGQAEARHERASAVTGPPSPFYFAAPAHFPIRGFGGGGEVIERPGAVIYEDMVFSFDAMGNYNLRFSILVPELPTTLHLQLQIQPAPGRPWYTITLPPQHFRPDDSRDSSIQPKLIRDYIVEGRSEILHRCYGQMGQDATIRRTGSARFGYGFDAMRQASRN